MFGTLKPHSCGMGCDRRHVYATFYCGLCKGLGDHFGTATRALLTYDAVFLALVADGLMVEKGAPDRCRCPMLPVVFRPTVRSDSTAMRYASAMQILLVDQWLADRAEGGGKTAKAIRPLFSGRVDTARALLANLGVSMAEMDGFEHVQARCERLGETDVDEASEPTREALGFAFGKMADLPGVGDEARTEEARAKLRAFGRHLGGAIYLIDALDDLEKDHASGDFNPCLVWSRRKDRLDVSWPRVERAWKRLRDDLSALDELVYGLNLRRHRDLVRSVVVGELRATADAAARKAHAHARLCDERPHSRGGIVARTFSAVVAALVFVWVWLVSLPALAQKSQDGGKDAAGEVEKPDARAPANWLPELPAPKPAPADEPSTSPSADTEDPPNAGASKGNDPPRTGGKKGKSDSGSSGSGGGCTNPCSHWGSCCKDCSSCKDCKGCDVCNDCCKGCGSCDSCCKGCCK